MRLWVILFFLGGGWAMSQDVIVHEASNVDPHPGPVGEQPYEMAGRVEERTPLITFEDVTGWEVEGTDAEGWLFSTEEQKIFRDRCAKLVYVGLGDSPSILVRPKTPLQIPAPWDSVNFWNYGNNWGWAPDPATPPLQVSIVLRDAQGAELEIPLGSMDYAYWFLMHARLHEEGRSTLVQPVYLKGVLFRNAKNKEKRTVYLGPCTFYKEEIKPLSFDPWPATLPFPTRPETILPFNKEVHFKNEVQKTETGCLFTYRGRDARLSYRYTPQTGSLGDIEVLFKGASIRPCWKGGLQLAGKDRVWAPDDEAVKRTLIGWDLDLDTLIVSWKLEAPDVTTHVTYRIHMCQKSLVVEMEASEPVVDKVVLGRASGLQQSKLFKVPYLTYGGNDPRVLYGDGLFFFNQFDWYASEASELYGDSSSTSDGAIFNGGAEYIPKTDGQRNRMRERLFITVSPDVQEVFPTIANPASPMREVQCDRLWRVKGGVDIPAEIKEATRLRAYGCDKIAIRYHEDSWRDAGESFTFRLEAAPKRGGDAALKGFVQSVQSLGWLVGLYTNYTDYAPVNRYWNEDWVNRLPNGDWQKAWMRCYAPKPMRAVEMEALLAPQIQAKFGENHSYCDVHTAVTPFSRVDYDARVPGAGTFRRTFECFGRLLYNEKFAHKGPVYSEGNNHWWYAGLTDGNYAQIISVAPPKEPLFVDFDLLKMHPLEMDAGMGAPGMFFKSLPHHLDQFIATTLAYGHIGYFDWEDDSGMLKIYYMMQGMQKDYVMVPVSRIEYEDQGKLVDTSQALASGTCKRNRVHVFYEGGMEIFVNGDKETWRVQSPEGRSFDLPEWGYGVWGKDGLMSLSVMVPVAGPEADQGPSRRVDLSLAREQYYGDSRGGFAFLGPLALEGSAALKKDGDSWWLIPATECADFGFDPALVKTPGFGEVQIQATDQAGQPVPGSPAETRWSRGLCHIRLTSPAFKFRLAFSGDSAPQGLKCDACLLEPGKTIRVQVPKGVIVEDQAFWEIRGQRMPCEIQVKKDRLFVQRPDSAQPGDHVWLGMPSGNSILWIDFLA